jgi:aryl-alcohol dehydrogenase-like predicted oxidoreductase
MDYGINSYSGKVQPSEISKILDYARQYNIDLIDTAPAYGSSEKVLGDLDTKDFQIVTKTRHFSQDVIGRQEVDFLTHDFNQSLELLNRKKVYGVLVHNGDDLLKSGADQIYKRLVQFKEDGLISKIGVSIYTNEQLKKVINNFDIDIVQLPFNILDRRLIDSGMFKLLKKRGIEIHARSIFLQGLLLISEKDIPVKFNQWKDLWMLWNDWLNDNNMTALEATVRCAISMKEISKVLVGVHSKIHLQEIVKASSGSLPEIPKELFINDVGLLNPSNW